MDFQFYQVDEILNYNVHNIEYTKEKRVFKSKRLGKGNYKLRSSRKLFDDICYFLIRELKIVKVFMKDMLIIILWLS